VINFWFSFCLCLNGNFASFFAVICIFATIETYSQVPLNSCSVLYVLLLCSCVVARMRFEVLTVVKIHILFLWVMIRGVQIPCARWPWRLNFLRWCLIRADHQYETISLFWRLKLRWPLDIWKKCAPLIVTPYSLVELT
jgi:hypothetical protein